MDFHFKGHAKVCHATGKPLQPGTQIHSIVVEQGGEFLRLDYSEEGWEGKPPEAIGYWKQQLPEAEDKPQVIDQQTWMALFESLAESTNPMQQQLLYVLSLMLLKSRRIQLEGQRELELGSFLEVTGSRGEGPYLVPNLDLPDEEISQLQQELTALVAVETTETEFNETAEEAAE